MSKGAQTISALLNTTEHLHLDLMEKCNCANNLLAQFFCSDEQCPNREKQTFYCSICLYQYHRHAPLLIYIEIKKLSKMWINLENNVSRIC